MKITQITTQTVISSLGNGDRVVAVDFRKGQFVELASYTVAQIRKLIERASDGTVKFWKIEIEETE